MILCLHTYIHTCIIAHRGSFSLTDSRKKLFGPYINNIFELLRITLWVHVHLGQYNNWSVVYSTAMCARWGGTGDSLPFGVICYLPRWADRMWTGLRTLMMILFIIIIYIERDRENILWFLRVVLALWRLVYTCSVSSAYDTTKKKEGDPTIDRRCGCKEGSSSSTVSTSIEGDDN